MANYVIDPQLLSDFLPSGTEIDFHEGRTFVSLVGFLFCNTRVRGIKIPYHVNFQEVNLRFYVKYLENQKWKRGTVFISEIVPRSAITLVANSIYHENYRTLPMKDFLFHDEHIRTGYQWKFMNHWNKIEVIAGNIAGPMIAGSEQAFIAEHYWGYAKYSAEVTYEYQVMHEPWLLYPVESYTIECDFKNLYDNKFEGLQLQEPSSVFLAKGSAIEVYRKRKLSY